jgi:hypothetical protein
MLFAEGRQKALLAKVVATVGAARSGLGVESRCS